MQDTDLLFYDTCYYGTLGLFLDSLRYIQGRHMMILGVAGYNSRTIWHLSDTKGVNAQ